MSEKTPQSQSEPFFAPGFAKGEWPTTEAGCRPQSERPPTGESVEAPTAAQDTTGTGPEIVQALPPHEGTLSSDEATHITPSA